MTSMPKWLGIHELDSSRHWLKATANSGVQAHNICKYVILSQALKNMVFLGCMFSIPYIERKLQVELRVIGLSLRTDTSKQ